MTQESKTTSERLLEITKDMIHIYDKSDASSPEWLQRQKENKPMNECDPLTKTTPSFVEKRLYVMEQMPNTGHLVSDNMIDRFYADLKNEEKYRHKDKFSDADFLRAVKMVGIITPEIERFNNRLERIAVYLEGIACPKQ